MSTKAEIENVIDTNLASESNITATEVRDTLKNNTHSLLTNFYPTELTDTESTENVLTLSTPASATFDLTITKTGRRVRLSMTITASSTITLIGIITAGELTSTTDSNYYAIAQIVSGTFNNQQRKITIVNIAGTTTLSINGGLSSGETATFTIYYNSNV
ncbi:MAG: hypothetical protein GY928_01915 [Colwellia sp.]|nr:hypothetical protein [Colwellia sp.]